MRKSSIAKVLSIILVFAIAISIATIANAYSVSMNLTSESELKAGNTVEVNINLTNIDAGEGIVGIEGKLSYDSNIFEVVNDSDVSSNTNWTITFNSATNKIALTKNDKVNSAETVATVKFKVKDTVNVSSTTIVLTDISVSGGMAEYGGTGDIEVSQASVSIKSVGANTNPIDNSDSQVPSSLVVNKSDSTTAGNNIPQTGDNYTIISLIAVVAVVAGITVTRYTILKRSMK